MSVPWPRLLDAALGVTNLALGRLPRAGAGGGSARGAADDQLEASRAGGLEARLAGVVVAALKEAFDRDSKRLELEREQLETERQRAERALEARAARQAGRE